MNLLVKYSSLIWLVIWFAVLFGGANVYRLKSWNEDAMSFGHTKAILGFCALGEMRKTDTVYTLHMLLSGL